MFASFPWRDLFTSLWRCAKPEMITLLYTWFHWKLGAWRICNQGVAWTVSPFIYRWEVTFQFVNRYCPFSAIVVVVLVLSERVLLLMRYYIVTPNLAIVKDCLTIYNGEFNIQRPPTRWWQMYNFSVRSSSQWRNNYKIIKEFYNLKMLKQNSHKIQIIVIQFTLIRCNYRTKSMWIFLACQITD